MMLDISSRTCESNHVCKPRYSTRKPPLKFVILFGVFSGSHSEGFLHEDSAGVGVRFVRPRNAVLRSSEVVPDAAAESDVLEDRAFLLGPVILVGRFRHDSISHTELRRNSR